MGQRLVEMLVERGAKRVVSFDIAPKPLDALDHRAIEYVQGDLTNPDVVNKICKGADCVWHIAALVGPFHKKEAYVKVNYDGTVNIINACRAHGVKKLVYSSSPSTRFDGSDIDGLKESEMSYPKKFLELYAETKAMGERAVFEACSPELRTVAIAPHQVYGPRDTLFLPNLLEAIGNGKLRVFGRGENKVSFCHVDNYAHGLILGYDALYEHSPALAKFYIVTDGPPQKFWRVLDAAGQAMGFTSLFRKFHLPVFLLMGVAYILELLGWMLGRRFKVNPFTVKMLTIHRWFNIEAARQDLGYEPIVTFENGWADTMHWFRENWLPKQSF